MALGDWNPPVNGTYTTVNTPNTTSGTNWYINGNNITYSTAANASYSFGFTGWTKAGSPVEEPDTFADWVTEVRRIAALEESIQGS